MKARTAKRMELYEIMLQRGYPEEFCEQITLNLNSDWTAQRMSTCPCKLYEPAKRYS